MGFLLFKKFSWEKTPLFLGQPNRKKNFIFAHLALKIGRDADLCCGENRSVSSLPKDTPNSIQVVHARRSRQ
jgi:hypothetical protein